MKKTYYKLHAKYIKDLNFFKTYLEYELHYDEKNGYCYLPQWYVNKVGQVHKERKEEYGEFNNSYMFLTGEDINKDIRYLNNNIWLYITNEHTKKITIEENEIKKLPFLSVKEIKELYKEKEEQAIKNMYDNIGKEYQQEQEQEQEEEEFEIKGYKYQVVKN